VIIINHLILMIYVLLRISTILLVFLPGENNFEISIEAFQVDMLNHLKLQKLSSIAELSRIDRDRKIRYVLSY
jgi:hypothetical protein